MYESTMESLEYLYPSYQSADTSSSTINYTTQCTAAVDDYRRDHDIVEPLQIADLARLAVHCGNVVLSKRIYRYLA